MAKNQENDPATVDSPPVDSTMPDPNLASDRVAVAPSDPNDNEDVPAALLRETQDGSGLENNDPASLPESDFNGFASDDVENAK